MPGFFITAGCYYADDPIPRKLNSLLPTKLDRKPIFQLDLLNQAEIRQPGLWTVDFIFSYRTADSTLLSVRRLRD